jgi:hypothetical protein
LAGGPALPPEAFVDIRFVFLREVRPDDSVVVQYSLDDYPPYIVNELVDIGGQQVRLQTFQRYFQGNPAPFFTISQYIFGFAANLTQENVSFSVADESLTFVLEVQDWDWENETSNRLEFEFRVIIGEDVTSTVATNVSTNVPGFTIFSEQFITDSALSHFAVHNFASFAPNAFTTPTVQNVPFTLVAAESNNTIRTYLYRFDGPFGYVKIDPSFGIFLDTTNDDGGSRDDSSTDNTALIVAITVTIPVAIFCVCLIVLVGFLFLFWKRRHLRNKIRRSSSVSHGRTSSL